MVYISKDCYYLPLFFRVAIHLFRYSEEVFVFGNRYMTKFYCHKLRV